VLGLRIDTFRPANTAGLEPAVPLYLLSVVVSRLAVSSPPVRVVTPHGDIALRLQALREGSLGNL
jgi:hypothetical protein